MSGIKQWIVSHKLATIITAIVLVAGITLGIVLPIALRHEHTYGEAWEKDATYHYHACTGEGCDEKKDKAEHTFVDKNNATQYWSECSVCGYQQEKIEAKVTDAQLANAILFKDAEGKYYTNFYAECTGFDTLASNVVEKVKYTVDKYYRYNCGLRATDPLEEIYANFNDDGAETHAKYTKNHADAEWEKTTGRYHYTESNLLNNAKSTLFMYGTNGFTFEYNEASNTYVATKSDSSITSTRNTIKFANGKLVSVVVERIKTSSQEAIVQYSWTISYGDATIELPSDDEIITPVPYKTSENEFALENLALTAGETEWFVIEITEAMLGSYDSTDIQANFNAGEGRAKLTIAIENAAGTAITNDSTTNGKGYFEGLSAGKYYIKITADAGCSGSLTVVFA